MLLFQKIKEKEREMHGQGRPGQPASLCERHPFLCFPTFSPSLGSSSLLVQGDEHAAVNQEPHNKRCTCLSFWRNLCPSNGLPGLTVHMAATLTPHSEATSAKLASIPERTRQSSNHPPFSVAPVLCPERRTISSLRDTHPRILKCSLFIN